MDDALELVLSKLDGVRQQGGYWMARCPAAAHDDTKASLSVARGTEQPVIFKCHAGCHRDDILDGLGLTVADVSNPRDDRPELGEWTPRGPAVNVYDYTDENGTLLFQVLRTANKEFPQRVPDKAKRSGWKWSVPATVRRVPYRLPAVIKAVADKQVVYIVEGEKDVHSMERAGAVATTSPGGAGKWRPDYNDYFKGASVVVIADADEPGRKHAATIARQLGGTAASVRIAEPAYGKDASDHLAAGRGLEFISAQVTEITFNVIDLEPATFLVVPPDPICGDKLYRGAVHTLTGAPDSGKTTLACWWVLLAIRQGLTALFLDEEGGTEIVAEKFQALGARPGERLTYIPFPGSDWGPTDVAMLSQLMAQRKPDIVMWDSAAAFLSKAGLDENSASDVTRFYSQVLTPAARLHGAAVIAIDHDTKSSEPSRYARGSGAKLAATDVAYKVSQVQPFAKMQDGLSRLAITKDRRGWLHRSNEVTFTAAKTAGEFLRVTIRETETDLGVTLRESEQHVLAVLGSRPLTQREVGERAAAQFGRRYDPGTISRALNELLRLNLAAQVIPDYGRSIHWKSADASP